MDKVLSAEKLPQILKSLDDALEAGAEPIAAVDADNTLWNIDMGEVYFQYIIDNNLVDLPEDPWSHYLDLKNSSHPPDGYLWLAQIMKGIPLEEAQAWSRKITELQPVPAFDSMKTLVSHLKTQGVVVYIVTASVKWAIESAASLYDIPRENVIGVKTKVVNGVITDEQEGAVTWKQGKVEGLLAATNNKSPFFTAGNSSGDIFLLECATHHRLAVQTVNEDHMIFNSEQELKRLAIKNNWWMHDHNL